VRIARPMPKASVQAACGLWTTSGIL